MVKYNSKRRDARRFLHPHIKHDPLPKARKLESSTLLFDELNWFAKVHSRSRIYPDSPQPSYVHYAAGDLDTVQGRFYERAFYFFRILTPAKLKPNQLVG